jgi:hypothetical protein
MLGVGVLAWALAFYRLNNQPFINIAQAFIIYLFNGKKYIWKKEIKKNPVPVEAPVVVEIPKNEQELTAQKIEDLARNLDILDRTRYN